MFWTRVKCVNGDYAEREINHIKLPLLYPLPCRGKLFGILIVEKRLNSFLLFSANCRLFLFFPLLTPPP